MSVAWPQKTAKGLGPPGGAKLADPYTESGERRARSQSPASGPAKPSGVGFPRAARDEDANPIIAS